MCFSFPNFGIPNKIFDHFLEIKTENPQKQQLSHTTTAAGRRRDVCYETRRRKNRTVVKVEKTSCDQ